MLGFCEVELNPFGPAHEYVPPPLEERFNVLPAQIGLLLEAEAVGVAFTVTDVVAVPVHVPLLTVTV